MPQLEKPDDLQSFGFFICMTIAFHDGNKSVFIFMYQSAKKMSARIGNADLASSAFGKITAVYGQIVKNEGFVRNWLARKTAITDKEVKNGRLSVKIQSFRTRFYGQMLRKAAFVRKFPV